MQFIFIYSLRTNSIQFDANSLLYFFKQIVYELPTTSQWCFDVSWCPRNPGVISTASFDGHVTVSSVMGGGAAHDDVPDKVIHLPLYPWMTLWALLAIWKRFLFPFWDGLILWCMALESNQFVDTLDCTWIIQSINQSMNQSINQSINQSMESINQWS